MKRHKLCAILNLSKNFEELKPLNKNRPVAALPFGCRYCIIDFMLSSISHAGIDSVALFIEKSGRSIYDHIRSAREWDMDSAITGGTFTFSQQRWKHRHFMENNHGQDYYGDHRLFMKKSRAGYVVVMSGEYVLNLDIDAVVQHHFTTPADITVVYQNVPAEQFGKKAHLKFLEIDEKGVATNLKEAAPEDKKLAMNTEIYILKIDTLNEIMDRANADGVYADVGEVLTAYLPMYHVNAFEYTGYLAGIDSVDAYYDRNMEMLEEAHFNSLFHSSKPVITRSKNGAPTFYAEESEVREAQCATGCEIYGKVYHSLLFRDVVVEQDAAVENSIIFAGGKIGRGAKLDYVILDKAVTVDEGVELCGTRDAILVVPKNTHVTKEWRP
ncbi:MAG TPA: glucose-1-phosphate adenylyltransferase subunit GlgD [Clostridiales bacterium]|nr:glucose-1-phosphate adenylyltransferase subunit GlgD [Clostridiales bacterium]